MDIDWDTLMFLGIWLGLFILLPISIYLGVKFFCSTHLRRIVVNVLGGCAVLLSLFMVVYPYLNPPTHPGALGIMILVPLGGLLALTCASILWFNNKS